MDHTGALTEVEKLADISFVDVRDDLFKVKSEILRLQSLVADLEQSLQQNGESESDLGAGSRFGVETKIDAIESEIEFLGERARHLESMLSYPASQALVTANVSGAGTLSKTSYFVLVFILSVVLAFVVVFGVIFVSRVKARTAAEG